MSARDALVAEGQPFLRWAGGKRWLVPQVKSLVSSIRLNKFHEPFVGGGAVLLGVNWPAVGTVSDSNSRLIETYSAVRENPHRVFQHLRTHRNTAEYYYELRQATFRGRYQRAAQFIFLNHTSFNGIHRVNLAGIYNVPFGNREKIQLPTRAALEAVSTKLAGASLRVGDFMSTIHGVKERDIVFLDPPYTVAHNNNGFVKYNQTLFSFDDQVRLHSYISKLRDLGAFYILTNASHESIRNLFDHGDRLMLTSRRNVVGGSKASRGSAEELLITNLPVAEQDCL